MMRSNRLIFKPNDKRKRKGQSLAELSVGLFILVPVILVIIDLVVFIIAVQVNNTACREAARIAASGNPSSAEERVQTVIDRSNKSTGGLIANLRLVSFDNTVTANQLAAMQPYGGAVSGTVTVTTAVDVMPSFLLQWACQGNLPITFKATQSFPYTYVVPNTATAN